MSALVITTAAAQACPNCDADMALEMTMKHGVTQKMIDDLLASGRSSELVKHSTFVLERCKSCGYKMEAG